MGMSPLAQPTVAEIQVTAFAQNVRAVRARLAPTCELMAVVKANAYGHGAEPLAAVALQEGASCLAVARCQEGISLRQYGITAPILVLGPVWPEDVEALVACRLSSVVGALEDARRLNQEAERQGQCYPVHVKVDTGMGRLGLLPAMAPALFDTLQTLRNLYLEGLMTHLATADLADDCTVREQLQRFYQVVQICATLGLTPRYVHAANSAALYRYPKSHGTLVRSGIALYGSHPFDAPEAALLQPVLTWKTRIARVQAWSPGCGISYGHTFITQRPSRIGTLPVGYADGFCRRLSNVGEVLVHGQRTPLVGQISMDMCMIDLTEVPHAEVGDEVMLLGPQGTERITAEEMAWRCGSIPYEIFCAISQRVPRCYV
jgi:alanine racemase